MKYNFIKYIIIGTIIIKSKFKNKMNSEDIFIKFELLNNEELYDFDIIIPLLYQLEQIFLCETNNQNKLRKIHKWNELFNLIGYDKKCYIFEWINDLYKRINN
jgi:hypothetical protein